MPPPLPRWSDRPPSRSAPCAAAHLHAPAWALLALILLIACSWGTTPTPNPPAQSPATAGEPVDPLEARRKALSEEMRELVDELEHAGRYDCCTQTPCKQCAFRTGGCRCGEGLRKGEPVCEECAMMWKMGQGAEAVDPATVRSFLEAQREETDKAHAGAHPAACVCGEEGEEGSAHARPGAEPVPARDR